jgi:SAM-dependent methyltransferase
VKNRENGWEHSANAWITDMGAHGDFGRRYVLDSPMLTRALTRSPRLALDVGCGEGRFCRMLRANDIDVIGIDPTPSLIATAASRDSRIRYIRGGAECLPFASETFDLVVAYLSLVDIPDLDSTCSEMTRVLTPGGTLLIANLNSFNTACCDTGWIRDSTGARLYYPLDNYLTERAMWIEYRGIRIVNFHRPLRTYLGVLLRMGLVLTYFDEPEPTGDAPIEKALNYRRAPWFHIMEWLKPRVRVPTTP